jgi:hypothetical protein
MTSKLALKRLTASDLTFFEWQFRHLGVGGQKSINLNADVFVDRLFPAIGDATRPTGRIPIDLWIFGPGTRPSINLQRKIIKWGTYKNWRLDGEFIVNPLDEPDRFNALAPGDYVIFSFEGEVVPTSATALFVSAANPEDANLHGVLAQFGLSGRDTMRALEEDEVIQIIARAQLPEDHPLASFAITGELQEAAIGSAAATERLLKRARAPRVSIDALRRAREQADEIGRFGEELIEAYLRRETENGRISSFDWVSEMNAVAPMDFRISQVAAAIERIDVKTTAGSFERPIHVSFSELKEMAAQVGGPYRIYRVYEASKEGAKLRISEDVAGFAQIVLTALAVLPPGTEVDAISVHPAGISFGEEITLAPADEGDGS